MIPMTIAKVQDSAYCGTVVVLVNEQKERAIPFQYSNQPEQSAGLFCRPLQENVVAEPLTIDLIINIIRALDGTIEEMEIDTLQEGIIYARLRLCGHDGEHFTVNTRCKDALPLAVRLNTPISIAEELMERSGIYLAEKGENWEQQLEAVVAMVHQALSTLSSIPPITNTKPRNLDFTQDLAGWRLNMLGNKDHFDIQLDPQTLYQGQQSLYIRFRESDPSSLGSSVKLEHEDFLADEYRGKRVRMIVYCKTSEVESARFKLSVIELDPSADNAFPRMKLRSTETLPIEGTSGWQRQEMVIDVPEKARKITLSFEMYGKGSIWLSGMQFAVVDESVPLSHFEISPSPSQPQNIDFQQGLHYWNISSSTPRDYDYGTEQESNAQGIGSAYIKALKEEPRSPLTLRQSVRIRDYIGKRVRLSGRLRASEVVEQANLYLRTGKENRIERSIEGTQGWTSYQMTLFVPDESIAVEFGLTLHGRGQVWLQGLTLAIVEDQT